MKRILLLVGLLILLAACTPSTRTAAPPEPTAVVDAPTEALPPISPVTESAPETSAPPPVFSPVPSFIQITSHLDGAAVNTQQVELAGMAPVGAVVSVNDTILIVGSDGQFKVTVTLEEGPNVIEIIASLPSGEQAYLLFGLFYEP